jgi:hypothetical protein
MENATSQKRISSLEKIAKLRARKADIDSRLAALEKAQSQRDRKRETRRKIIAGSLALQLAGKEPNFRQWLVANLSRLKEGDRTLFPDFLSSDGQPVAADRKPV